MHDIASLRAAEARVLAHVPVAVTAHDLPFAGGTLHYLTAGDAERPPLVLVHGRGSASILWYPIITRLAEQRRILAVDLPGWGLSAGVPFSGKTGEDAVNWWRDGVLAAIDYVRITQFALLGHSLGGMVSMAVAAARPAAVTTLLLEDPAGFPGKISLWARLFFALEPERLARLTPQALLTWTRQRLAPAPSETADMASALVTLNRLLETQRASGVTAFNRLLSIRGGSYSMEHALPKLTMPTHIMLGERDPLIPRAVVQAGMRAIPHADLTLIPDAGHNPHLEQPTATGDLIARLLG
jgi:pimeloyl-ACP methyl ester carboxylesterase